MYYQEDRDQISMEEFFLPLGGRLRKDNHSGISEEMSEKQLPFPSFQTFQIFLPGLES